MAVSAIKRKKEFIEIDSTELKPAQVRQIKAMVTMLNHILTTEDESEYFDGSAEAMRMCAALIKQARFVDDMKANNIPYAEQVIEYSLDILQDHIETAKVVTYDN